ncbi:hypothetical protein ACFFUA_36780, partial [Streptomyces heliomycini]
MTRVRRRRPRPSARSALQEVWLDAPVRVRPATDLEPVRGCGVGGRGGGEDAGAGAGAGAAS